MNHEQGGGSNCTAKRLQSDEHELNDRAHAWITGIKKQFVTAPAPAEAPMREPEPFSFKML